MFNDENYHIMAILKFLTLAIAVVCVKGQARPALNQCPTEANGYETVEKLAELATFTVDEKTTIPIEGSEESVETAERISVPAFRFIDPCPIRHEFSGIVYGFTIKNDFVLVLWPQTFHKAICRPGNDCPKCSGNCVQQYKYENALVYSQCSLRWDLIKVESGCCCHQYQRNSITYRADATI